MLIEILECHISIVPVLNEGEAVIALSNGFDNATPDVPLNTLVLAFKVMKDEKCVDIISSNDEVYRYVIEDLLLLELIDEQNSIILVSDMNSEKESIVLSAINAKNISDV